MIRPITHSTVTNFILRALSVDKSAIGLLSRRVAGGKSKSRLCARRWLSQPPAIDTTSSNPRLRGVRLATLGQKHRAWMENYQALLEYKNLHRHCRVPLGYPRDRPLGQWVFTQRANGKESLTSEQLKLLDDAGFDWETQEERNNRLWQEWFEHLVLYKKEHGDCRVPQKCMFNNRALGDWVRSQRKHRKQGKIRIDRQEQLDAIGFTWIMRKVKDCRVRVENFEVLWDTQFQKLEKFRKQWGHCLVPNRFAEDPSLGNWVRRQRSLFHEGKLRPDRRERLEEVDFEFGNSDTSIRGLDDRHWHKMFEHLKDYKAASGHCDVSGKFEQFGLGQWVRTQRNNKDSMSEQRRERLNDIGFSWVHPRNIQSIWMERFKQVSEYSNRHGTCRVKKKENPSLANWVCKQRSRIKKATLPEERVQMLESIGFD